MVANFKALDLFCCAGGASVGLHRAGFDVTGVDIEPQPNYPFACFHMDALAFPLLYGPPPGRPGYDFVWASPPCQKFCALNTREDLSHYPDLIEPVRRKLIASGIPFVIENVAGAPVRHDLMLCGAMFGLRSYRHRYFECSFPIEQPAHPKHLVRVNRRGENRRQHWATGGFITITGDIGTYCGPEAMGIDWMNGNEMSEAIPPAYAEYVGKFAISFLRENKARGSVAFDGIEATATTYLRLPKCGSLPCRNPSATAVIVPAIRSGRLARNKLESAVSANPGAPVDANLFSTLTTSTDTIKAILNTYGVN